MKILILTALLGALGVGSYLFAGSPAAPKAADSCDATVTCTPEGNCLVTCTNDQGETCSIEIACDDGECRIVGCDGPENCAPENCAPDCPPECPPQATPCCQKP